MYCNPSGVNRRGRHPARLLPAVAAAFLAACSPGPEGVFRAYIKALNAHDIDKVISLHAEEFALREAGGGEALTRNDLHYLLGWDAAMGGSYEFKNLRREGDKLAVTLIESNRFYEALGVDKRHINVAFRFKDGLIVEETLGSITDQGRPFDAAFRDFAIWVGREHAGAMPKLTRDGRFVFSSETAPHWLPILEDWRRRRAGA